MSKKILKFFIAITSIILFVIMMLFFVFFNNTKQNNKVEEKNNPKNRIMVGVIESKKIDKDSQYLNIKDDDGVFWKVYITENTIFRKMLNLNEGDKLKIKGDIKSETEFNSFEIDSVK